MANRKQKALDPDNDIVWGARAIGKVINRSERQARYLMEKGLPVQCHHGNRFRVAETPARICVGRSEQGSVNGSKALKPGAAATATGLLNG